jgi:hypothetical protein
VRSTQIGDPTLADGILDRLVHNAHRIQCGVIPCAKIAAKTNGQVLTPCTEHRRLISVERELCGE